MQLAEGAAICHQAGDDSAATMLLAARKRHAMQPKFSSQ